jgi:hypothetical protein
LPPRFFAVPAILSSVIISLQNGLLRLLNR